MIIIIIIITIIILITMIAPGENCLARSRRYFRKHLDDVNSHVKSLVNDKERA